MVSIKDLSKELGIAVSTVSMALNDNPKISKKTRELVQKKARELKYVKSGVAVDLQKRKTNLILLVLYDASRSFFSNVIRELQNAVANAGYDLIISTTYGGHTSTAEKYIKERRTDGVIVYTKTIPDELMDLCASKDFPIFVLGHKVLGKNKYVRSFHYGTEEQTLITADYLIGLGHKRLAYVKGFHESFNTIRSLKYFEYSMKVNGLEFNDSMVFDANGNSELDGYNVAKNDIAKRYKEFDALVFANDDIALGALRAFREIGIRVPEDISVVGSHNIPQSATSIPPLTTYSSDSEYADFYQDTINLLVSYIEKKVDTKLEEKITQYKSFDYIVERESVKKLV